MTQRFSKILVILILLCVNTSWSAHFIPLPQGDADFKGLPSRTVFDYQVTRDGKILIATNGGLSISTDNGKTFSTLSRMQGLPSGKIDKIVIDEKDGKTIFVVIEGRIYRVFGNFQGVIKVPNLTISSEFYELAIYGDLIVVLGNKESKVSMDGGVSARNIDFKCPPLVKCQSVRALQVWGETSFAVLFESAFLTTQDSGATFRIVGDSNGLPAKKRAFTKSSNQIFFLGADELWKTNSDISTFEKLDGRKQLPQRCSALDATGNKLIVNCSLKLFSSSNGGETFSAVQVQGQAVETCQLKCFRVSGNMAMLSLNHKFLITNDFGITWFEMNMSGGFINGEIQAITKVGNVLFVQDSSALFRSYDSGHTFQLIREGHAQRLFNFENQLELVEDGTVFISNDLGENFKTIKVSERSLATVGAFYMDADKTVIGNYGTLILRSRKTGEEKQWDLQSFNYIYDIQYLNNELYIVTHYALKKLSADGMNLIDVLTGRENLFRVNLCQGRVFVATGQGQLYFVSDNPAFADTVKINRTISDVKVVNNTLLTTADEGLLISKDCGKSFQFFGEDVFFPIALSSQIYADDEEIFIGTESGLAAFLE